MTCHRILHRHSASAQDWPSARLGVSVDCSFFNAARLHHVHSTVLPAHFTVTVIKNESPGIAAKIVENDVNAGIQTSQLAQTILQSLGIELDRCKDFSARKKCNFRAVLSMGITDHCQRRFRNAASKPHIVFFALTPYAQLQPIRQRIDDTKTYADQAVRNTRLAHRT